MSIRSNCNRFGTTGWRVHLVRVLLAAFALRAIIPVGYMPDLTAVSNGVLKIVICSSDGIKTVALNADGTPAAPDRHGEAHKHPCAFSGIGGLILAAAIAPPPPMSFDVREQSMPRYAADLLDHRAGPPLGSRAPPSLS